MNMTELFANINPDVKEYAKTAWSLALAQRDPAAAADFLNTVTNYYKVVGTPEEVEFLRFYFNMQMEMMDK